MRGTSLNAPGLRRCPLFDKEGAWELSTVGPSVTSTNAPALCDYPLFGKEGVRGS
jgi:hypothetical protein